MLRGHLRRSAVAVVAFAVSFCSKADPPAAAMNAATAPVPSNVPKPVPEQPKRPVQEPSNLDKAKDWSDRYDKVLSQYKADIKAGLFISAN